MTERKSGKLRDVLIFIGLPLLLLTAVLFLYEPEPAVSETVGVWVPVNASAQVYSLTMPGKIEPGEKRVLVSPFAGNLKALHVGTGDFVEKGHILAEVDTLQLEGELREARAALLKAELTLQELKSWRTNSQVQRLNRAISLNEKMLSQQRRSLADSRRLFERGIISRNELQEQEQQVDSTVNELASLKNEMHELLRQGEGDVLRIAEMDVTSAREKVRQLDGLRQKKMLSAPFSGVVLSVEGSSESGTATLQAGSAVTAGQPLIQLADVDRLRSHGYVSENDMTRLAPGQPVTLSGEGFKGETLSGQLASIGFIAQDDHSGEYTAMYPVMIHIDELSPEQRQAIRPGMTARITIETGRKLAALVVPPEAIGQCNSRHFIYYRASSEQGALVREVTPGKAVPEGVEVTGIEDGEVLSVWPKDKGCIPEAGGIMPVAAGLNVFF